MEIHTNVREKLGLPLNPPDAKDGTLCKFCANNCQIPIEEKGYCGVRYNKDDRIISVSQKRSALAYMYLDPLPTNCCAERFCSGAKRQGYNLAVFFYGCNFNCLFCQNASHKYLDNAGIITEDKMVEAALDPMIRCVCLFGGSPEPQLPFASGALACWV